jgi:uncharacterized protein DUF4260
MLATLSLAREVGNAQHCAQTWEPTMAVTRLAGAVEGMPRLLLRIEGAALALAAVYMFHRIGGNWWWFALILAPDISMAAYFLGTRPGAIAYNATHVTLVPLVLAALGFLLPSFDLLSIALVWAAHIGADRALGLGLKYGAGFGLTHLGRIGGQLAGS